MKKLSLKNLKLDAKELLQKDQLKAVFGGYTNAGCHASCSTPGHMCYTYGTPGPTGVCTARLCVSQYTGDMITINVCIDN